MIAFFFLIGILGTIQNIDTVSFRPYLHSMQQEGMTQPEDTRDDWLLPVCSLQKIDDFQADAVAVSYTHLDVYKRQVFMGTITR